MPQRHLYRLQLEALPYHDPPDDLDLRAPVPDDIPALGRLMLSAYRGTIDYEGETLEETKEEMRRYFSGAYGEALLDCSWLASVAGEPASACLLSNWADKNGPLVAFVMTAADHKGAGLGAVLLQNSLQHLKQRDYQEAWAVITEGNTASENIFQRLGFIRQAAS